MRALRRWAGRLRRNVAALWVAARDARTPFAAKAVAAAVVAYALSPIDLIPDFVPVLGYLDDLVLLPAGIALALRLIPPRLLAEYRWAARRSRPAGGKAGVAAIAGLWALAAIAGGWWLRGAWAR